MKNRAKGRVPEQAGAGLLFTAQQLLLPMIEGLVHSRRELFAWVQQVGISALNQLFELDALELAGPKGKHSSTLSHYRWGSAQIALPFGGRQIVVPCPRVRGIDGGEAHLRSVAQFRASDPVPARVLNQVLLGVSTRGYGKSLEPLPAEMVARGASKSAASRHLIARMTDKLREQLRRRLDDLDLLVLMVDGIEVAHRTVVVALGILADGRKVVLGLWLGSTENAVLCTALLNDLLERGLKVEGRILCVIDGGRGIRKALGDVSAIWRWSSAVWFINDATSSSTCRLTAKPTSRACCPRPGTARPPSSPAATCTFCACTAAPGKPRSKSPLRIVSLSPTTRQDFSPAGRTRMEAAPVTQVPTALPASCGFLSSSAPESRGSPPQCSRPAMASRSRRSSGWRRAGRSSTQT